MLINQYQYMNTNEMRKELIEYTRNRKGITKKELAKLLEITYPTMLSKLNNPASLKLSEVDRICRVLRINLTEFLTINN
jgi:DNA-binding Xre family transcriptional regulator